MNKEEKITCPFCNTLDDWKKLFKPEKGTKRKYKIRLMQYTQLTTDEGNKRSFENRIADFNLVFCPVCGCRISKKKGNVEVSK